MALVLLSGYTQSIAYNGFPETLVFSSSARPGFNLPVNRRSSGRSESPILPRAPTTIFKKAPPMPVVAVTAAPSISRYIGWFLAGLLLRRRRLSIGLTWGRWSRGLDSIVLCGRRTLRWHCSGFDVGGTGPFVCRRDCPFVEHRDVRWKLVLRNRQGRRQPRSRRRRGLLYWRMCSRTGDHRSKRMGCSYRGFAFRLADQRKYGAGASNGTDSTRDKDQTGDAARLTSQSGMAPINSRIAHQQSPAHNLGRFIAREPKSHNGIRKRS